LNNSFGSRLVKTLQKHGQLCVGIDPSLEQLSDWNLSIDVGSLESFGKEIIDGCHDLVGIVKLQVAFFEQFGSAGFAVLEKLSSYAVSSGLVVIADAKRGDIGTTMGGYARAWLIRDSAFHADAVTLSPFLGADSLNSAVAIATANDKGVFILCATSNPEAKILQTSIGVEAKTVARQVADYAVHANTGEIGSVGLVIGADTKLTDYGLQVSDLTQTPILAPGFGHQGAKLEDVKKIFGVIAGNLVCHASRSIAGASSTGLRSRIQQAKDELSRGLSAS
jgi:orotidine-5'-phosphate decarboxylase